MTKTLSVARLAALSLLAAGSAIVGPAAARGAPTPRLELQKRWVYVATNLTVAARVDALLALIDRAAAAHYTGILLADSKFARLGEMGAGYFAGVARVRARAAALHLEIIPSVFSLGWAEGLLSHDPNLAEALPVKDALFVVNHGTARLVADPAVTLKGGDFADLSIWDWKDDVVTSDAGAARVTDPKGRNARIVQTVRVAPFRQYHLSVRVKTKDFQGEPEVKVLAGERSLSFQSLGAKSTQEFTESHVVFNSLDLDRVTVYLGVWGGGTGSLWWDDARLEEVGFLNVVRRDGAPLSVRREGGAALVEGRDFEPVSDPRMGTVPWRGGYEVWHEAPPLATHLGDGTRLRVSFHHALTVGDGQVVVCPSEPKTVELLRDEARRVHAAWNASGYFMQHDEIRVLGWDDACARRGLSAGQILADDARTCVKILRETNPGGDVYVWSDMFDPTHNAHDGYYLVRRDLSGSWEGIDKDVIVAAWNYGKRAESLRWFSGRGHRTLIAGYYDGPPERVRGWLAAARGVPQVVGVMYTTWRDDYGNLERFAREVEDHR